jgi:hypothetical protein
MPFAARAALFRPRGWYEWQQRERADPGELRNQGGEAALFRFVGYEVAAQGALAKGICFLHLLHDVTEVGYVAFERNLNRPFAANETSVP